MLGEPVSSVGSDSRARTVFLVFSLFVSAVLILVLGKNVDIIEVTRSAGMWVIDNIPDHAWLN